VRAPHLVVPDITREVSAYTLLKRHILKEEGGESVVNGGEIAEVDPVHVVGCSKLDRVDAI
jgi:hypothetical protein